MSRRLNLFEVQMELDAQLATWAVPEALTAPVAALQCFRGIDRLTALTLAAEIGDGRRFGSARAFMHYTGLTCWEWSSGARRRQRSRDAPLERDRSLRQVAFEPPRRKARDVGAARDLARAPDPDG